MFERTFTLLDETFRFDTDLKDGDRVEKGQLIGTLFGDIRACLLYTSRCV